MKIFKLLSEIMSVLPNKKVGIQKYWLLKTLIEDEKHICVGP